MKTNELKQGDCVSPKNDGYMMIVNEVVGEIAVCDYFTEYGAHRSGNFPVAHLQRWIKG